MWRAAGCLAADVRRVARGTAAITRTPVRSARLKGPEAGPRAGPRQATWAWRCCSPTTTWRRCRRACPARSCGPRPRCSWPGCAHGPQQACQRAAACLHTAADTVFCLSIYPIHPNPAPYAGHHDQGRHLLHGHRAVGDCGRCAPAARACPTLPCARAACAVAGAVPARPVRPVRLSGAGIAGCRGVVDADSLSPAGAPVGVKVLRVSCRQRAGCLAMEGVIPVHCEAAAAARVPSLQRVRCSRSQVLGSRGDWHLSSLPCGAPTRAPVAHSAA